MFYLKRDEALYILQQYVIIIKMQKVERNQL